jgi:hypothetical protein
VTSVMDGADLIADTLNADGFDVRDPTQSGSSFLQITNVPGALCELTICNTVFDWEYRHLGGSRLDPSAFVAMASCILGADQVTDNGVPVSNSDMTLKGQVGRALADKGMQVSLGVLDLNEQTFDVYAEIAIGNPACPERGTVRVADDGLISWHCQLPGPEGEPSGLDVDEIAKTLARTLAIAGPCPTRP